MNIMRYNGYSFLEQEAARLIVESAAEDMVSYAEFHQILMDTALDGRVESIDEGMVFSLVLDMGLRVGEAIADQQNQYVSFVAWRGSREEESRCLFKYRRVIMHLG